MVATGLTKNERFLQCKSSFRNDPNKIPVDGDDIEIIHISLDPYDTSSTWTLFYDDYDAEPCFDAFFMSIDLNA